MPLDEDETLELHRIYGDVLLEEDPTSMKKTRSPDEKSGCKTLDSIKDIFHVEDKLARKIILTGEAGQGKTVLCLKLIDSWSESKKVP